MDLKVETDTGYETSSNIHITQPFKHYNIETVDGYEIICADNHILFDEEFNEVFTKDLKIGDLIKQKMATVLSRVFI